MGIKTSIERYKDDLDPPEKKSYRNIDLSIKLVPKNRIIIKKRKSDGEERLVNEELAFEIIEKLILIKNKSSQRLTLFQIFSLFDDIGFNCSIFANENHLEDYNAVCNMGGFIIPFYEKIVAFFIRKKPLKRFFLYKIGPGKKRLHLRFYDNGDGSWYIAAHVDNYNWLNFFSLINVFRTHLRRGTGDYIAGTKMTYALLMDIKQAILKNNSFDFDLNRYEPLEMDNTS